MTLPKEKQQPPISAEDQALLDRWTPDMEENTWDSEDDRYTSHIFFQHIVNFFKERDKGGKIYARTVLSAEYLGVFGGPISRYALWKVLVRFTDIRHTGENNLSTVDSVYLYQNCLDQDGQFYYLDREAKDVRSQPDLEKVKKYTELWDKLVAQDDR